MSAKQGIVDLALRKQQLVEACERQRAAMAHEARQIEERLAWADKIVTAVRKLSPLWLVIAPVAGFVIARGASKRGGILRFAARAWSMYGIARSVWHGFQQGRGLVSKETPRVTE